MRLDKYLADMGAGSRSSLKKSIRSGSVHVNGTQIRDPGFHVGTEDEVVLDGMTVRYEENVYYLMNKPAGVISATEDRHQRTVLDLIAEPKRSGLFPVGRLDIDTEGLLLITNDGALAHRLLSPAHHIDKIYEARVGGAPVTHRTVRLFSEGFAVDDSFTAMPSKLEILEADNPALVRITIHEGKFHQIKRMFASVGSEVLYLKRIAMGPLSLDPSLHTGEYRRLTEDEIGMLKSL